MFKYISKQFNSLKKSDLIKFLVASVIIAIPLYPKFPFIKVPLTYVSIRIEDFLIFIITIVLFSFAIFPLNLSRLKKEIAQFFTPALNKKFVLFWGVTLLSVIAGILLTHTVNPLLGVLHWGRRIEYMIMFFLGIVSLNKRQNLNFYLKCFILVIFFAFAIGILQKYYNFPVITTQNSEYSQGVALRYMPGGHLVSTFAGHYDMATYMILTSPFICALFFVKGIKNHEKIILMFAILSSFWLLVNAASRISIVSYMGGVILTLFIIKRYKYIPIFIVLSLIFVAFSTNLIDRYDQIINVLKHRTSEVISLEVKAQTDAPLVIIKTPTPVPVPVIEDRSTSIRLNIEWPRALRAIEKNPILGTGFSSITLATDNDYLRLLGEAGILGFVTFFLIFIEIIKVLLKNIPRQREITTKDAFIAGIIGTLPGIFLNSFFIDVFESSKFAITLWLLLGLAVAASVKNYENKQT